MTDFLNFQTSILDDQANTFIGSNGQDLIIGLGGNDTLQGLGGADYINGNKEIDRIDGGDGNDTLRGGMNHDDLSGGAGDDLIYGDFGADTIVGGTGSDWFVVEAGRGGADASSTDIITDFTDGDDRIFLNGGLTSANVTIAQGTGNNANDTLITLNSSGEILAILLNTVSTTITTDDLLPRNTVSSVKNSVNFSGVDTTNEAAVRALGGPVVTVGNSSIYIGYEQVSSNNQNPRLIRFTNGVRDWYRTDYEVTDDDSTGVGLLWDGAQTLYATFTSTGSQGTPDQDFRRFATNGWLSSYGQGGGAKVAIVAKLDPSTGNVQNATFVSAVLNNGNSNSLAVKELSLSGNNVVVSGDSFFFPRRADKTAMVNTGVDQQSPFDYTIEFTPDLSTAVRAVAPDFGS